MVKTGKILTKILAGVLAVLLIAALVLCITDTSRQKFEGADVELSSWMSGIADDTPINKIAIPGSHDAGTAGIMWLGETQTYTIGQQLSSGVRYFDIRVHEKGDKLVIFHSFMDGADFGVILANIRDFITENPSEVLLLDFQHFKGGSQQRVYMLLRKELYDNGLVVENTTDMTDVQFIRSLTLGDVRGKCIIFWGDRSDDHSSWLFLRNDDECTLSDMCLDSYYIGSYHKAPSETLISDAHPIYFDKLAERQAAGEDAIFVLQCQLTDGTLVCGPWSREREQDAGMSEYIRSLAQSDKLDGINVIMRDFITPEKCEDIIALNTAKGNM